MEDNVIHGQDAKKALLKAINLVGDSVIGTLGPNARTVLVQHEGHPPSVLNDGVKIASSIRSSDPAVQVGIELFRQVALEAQQASGDGTTTATLIAQALCEHYFNSEDPVTDAQVLKTLLRSAVEELEQLSTPVDMDDEELVQLEAVATIAANNDKELGGLITDMFQSIGADGLVNLKVGSEEYCYWESVSGSEMPSPYVSPMMCNTNKRTFEQDNPLFIITKEVIEDFDDLTPALEVAIENGRPLVIICQDIKGVALSNLIANVVGGVVNACAIRIPRNDSDEWFEDLNALVGGKIFFSSEKGTGITNAVAGEGQFGSAERIVVGQDTTVIVAGKKSDGLKGHLVGLKEQAESATHPFLQEKLLTRHARLDSNMASIYIGGFSEAEIRETRERVDDAVNATRLAIKNGVLVGGGWSLHHVAQMFPYDNFFKWALETPMRTLRENGRGFVPNGMGWEEYYLNTKTEQLEEVANATVLDPTSVVINSLKAAVSIARLMLLTDTIILTGE